MIASFAATATASMVLATPAMAAVPPTDLADVTATGGHEQVLLTWTVPADPDIEQVIVRRAEGTTPPADPTAGTSVYSSSATGGDTGSVRDFGLTNGMTYAYSLWSVAAGPSYSDPVTVVATPVERAATSLTLRVDRKRVEFGQRVEVKARLFDENLDVALPGENVQLQQRVGGTDRWRVLDVAITDAGGQATWSKRLDASSRLRVVHAVTAYYAQAVSPVREVLFSPLLTSRLSKSWARQLGHVSLRGRVKPGYREGKVVLERRIDGAWRAVAGDRQNSDGEYSFWLGGWAERGTFRYRVVLPETAKHRRVTGQAMHLDVVRVVTYQIETRGRIVASLDQFRERVAEIYADPRGWSRAYVRFVRVKRGADFSVVLSQARYVATFAPICDTYYSCRVGRYVVINQDRWRFGTPYFLSTGSTLKQYRAMVVNHETGHWFSLGHSTCGKRGARAPVMMQQSKGLAGCRPNPWPLPGEIARAY